MSMDQNVFDDLNLAAGKIWKNELQVPSTDGDPVVGVDLGTADIIFLVLDSAGTPLGGFIEWTEVVRDGVVLDYVGTRSIIKEMFERAAGIIGKEITYSGTSFPPGTDPKLSMNVIQDCGVEVAASLDEPSAAAIALNISDGIVVDIGGGTTGISVLQAGSVAYSADEATGGQHLSLVLAGGMKIPYAEAEIKKRTNPGSEHINIVRPVIEKMASIVVSHVKGVSDTLPVYLVGGTPSMDGFGEIFEEEIGRKVIIPPEPQFVTPLGIARSALENKNNSVLAD